MESNYVTVTLCIINRAAVGTEFLSPYPPHAHTHGDPHGSPYPRQSPGLPWGRNFYPHTHPVLIPMGIPMGSPYPRQSSGLPWGRNFYPHTHPIHMGIPMDPHTHGRVQGCRGDGISILIHIPYQWGSPWGSPYPRHT